MFFLILLLIHTAKTSLYKESHPPMKFKIHHNEERVILQRSLRSASDVVLQADPENQLDLCHVQPKSIFSIQQEISFIYPFNETTFEEDEFYNFNQFVFMSHIHDGLLVVTSNRQVYMLKFNYSWIYNTEYSDLESNGEFVHLVWKNNLDQVTPTFSQENEIPQLFFSDLYNTAFIAFTYELLVFNVTLLEYNRSNVPIYPSLAFVPRKERGWTKISKDLIFTAVGHEGLDIYRFMPFSPFSVVFLKNVQATDLYPNEKNPKPLIVNDFELVQDKNDTYLYLIDETRGILVILFRCDQNKVELHLMMSGIGPQFGGIALDTFDGSSVFGIYKINGLYHAIEFYIQYHTQDWEIFEVYTSRKKIVDVKVNEDFAVLQGMNYHRIVFYGVKPEFKPNSRQEQINFEHYGLRDFDFFKPKLSLNKTSIKNRGPFSNLESFIFGVTSQKIFVMKYFINTPFISCFSDDTSLKTSHFKYTVLYNTSTCSLLKQKSIQNVCQNQRNFEVELITTYIYRDKLIVSLLTIAAFIVVFFCVLGYFGLQYLRYRKTSHKLQNELARHRIKSPQEHSVIQMADNQNVFEKSDNQSPHPRD